jgi:hypothetical protein
MAILTIRGLIRSIPLQPTVRATCIITLGFLNIGRKLSRKIRLKSILGCDCQVGLSLVAIPLGKSSRFPWSLDLSIPNKKQRKEHENIQSLIP